MKNVKNMFFVGRRFKKTVLFEDGREEVDPEMKTERGSTYSYPDAHTS